MWSHYIFKTWGICIKPPTLVIKIQIVITVSYDLFFISSTGQPGTIYGIHGLHRLEQKYSNGLYQCLLYSILHVIRPIGWRKIIDRKWKEIYGAIGCSHTHTHIYIYICIYIYVCVCVSNQSRHTFISIFQCVSNGFTSFLHKAIHIIYC